MSTDIKSITEKTLIPISLLTIIIGAAMWLTSLWELSKTSAKDIEEIKIEQKESGREVDQKFDKILNELSYLKGKIDTHFGVKAKE